MKRFVVLVAALTLLPSGAAAAAARHEPAERIGRGAEGQFGVAIDAGRERMQERGHGATIGPPIEMRRR